MSEPVISEKRREFGWGVRKLRLARRLTQSQLAAKAGILPTHLSEIERGRRQCGPSVTARLAAALGLVRNGQLDFRIAAATTTYRGVLHGIEQARDILGSLVLESLRRQGVDPRTILKVEHLHPDMEGMKHIEIRMSNNRTCDVEVRVTMTT